MKCFSAVWLACGLLFFADRAPGVLIDGQNYVSFAGWAAGNGLKTAWVVPGSEVTASAGSTRVSLTVNTHDARINGVHVVLSYPIANDHGNVLVAEFDLDKTVRPLLYPSRYLEARKITTICLDPGHGGKDSGNRVGGFFGHSEKTYTLLLALELRDQLRRAGFNVLLTRSRDTYVDLPERPAMANRAGADLFISLHFNASQVEKNEVAGPETYCITPVGAASSNSQGEGADYGPTPANRFSDPSLLLAWEIQKSLVQNLHVEDRGVRRARFAVLRDAEMPAILIEGGYMTNPAESKRIYDASWRRQMAAALVKGIQSYQRLVSPSPAGRSVERHSPESMRSN